MPDDELISIGRFARLSGVSVHALRHYDDVGLLSPADADPSSGYRRYRREQIRPARLIRALRWIDLPIDAIRHVLTAADDTRSVLSGHVARLRRERNLLDARIDDALRLMEKGLEMPEITSGCRPVQIMLAVDDHQQAVDFYRTAFDLHYDISRRTEHGDYSSFQFGRFGEPDFFLLWLLEDPERLDRPPGRSNFSFLVDDVDAAHRRAVEAGATEVAPPRDAEGMPRGSRVTDPFGNLVGLAQGGSGCRPVQIMLAVDDREKSVDFYRAAFGMRYAVSRRTSHGQFSSFQFGTYGDDDFFLLWLLDDPERLDRPGRSNFGLLVDDLDVVHRQALAAGATEMMPPGEAQGMPRHSAVTDRSGNWIGLFQG